MRKTLLIFLALLLGMIGASHAESVTCKGKFINPVTDICWSCAFPLRLAGLGILTMGQEDNGTSNNGIFCACGLEVGVPLGFWEPIRMVETVREPYCFPSLGGMKLDIDINSTTTGGIILREGAHGRTGVDKGVGSNPTSFYQAHWYINPIWAWLEVLTDHPCIETGTFDLAYFTEVDPLWHDSKKTFLINPEAALFANMVAQLACPVDCIAATAGFPLNELFWCAGCQGNLFPLDGWVSAHVGGVQASSLITARMIAKMHREGLIFSGSGSQGMCGVYWDPIMDKRNYKTQMVHPVAQTKKILGRCCQPIGRSTMVWGAGKEFPYRGEDFTYMIFRKRDCCSGGFSLSDAF